MGKLSETVVPGLYLSDRPRGGLEDCLSTPYRVCTRIGKFMESWSVRVGYRGVGVEIGEGLGQSDLF